MRAESPEIELDPPIAKRRMAFTRIHTRAGSPSPPAAGALRSVLVGCLLVLLAGCGGGGGTQPGGSSPPQPGLTTLTAVTDTDLKTIDSAKAFDTWSTAVVHAFTRRLVDYDSAGKLVPDLAERWEVSKDGKTYTFHLRDDAQFSDGSPIQARHFQAAIERVIDPATESSGSSLYAGIARMESDEPHTFVVHLKAADPTLVNLMGMTFAAPIQLGRPPDRPASSGPYELIRYTPGTEVVLERNKLDTRGQAGVDRLVLQLQVAEPLQMTRFRSGELDLLPAIPPAEHARVMNDPAERSQVAQGVVNQTWYFGMNTSKPPWNNPKVRRAALLAINRRQHVDFSGGGQEANGMLPPHVPGYNPDRKLPTQDASAAKQVLTEAGYPDGLPETMKTVMWLANQGAYPRHAQAIQSDLRAAGIPVDLRAVTYSEYLSGYRREADCWYGGWYPDFPDAGNFLEPVLHGRSVGDGKNNAARYRNPRFDALLDRARVTPLGPQRDALYRQAEDVLLQDLPWIPLYFEAETRYFRPGVTGVEVHPVWRQKLTGIGKRQ